MPATAAVVVVVGVEGRRLHQPAAAATVVGVETAAAAVVGVVGRRLHQTAGLVMIAMGVTMMTGRLSAFSYWLLDAFPVLGRLG